MRANCILFMTVLYWLYCSAVILRAAEHPEAVLKHYPADTEGTPTPPAEVLRRAQLPPNFHMTCFAAEPDVLQPIAIQVDNRGRLWVAECFSYPQWSATGRDRLTILADDDGDGRFDTRKIFWSEGNYLTGFIPGYGGVFVCSAPDLLFIPDHNGDDVPDGPPEKILTGWSTQGKHNVVNGLQWGPDGWLYGCNGITAPSKVRRPDQPANESTEIACGIWRYHVPTKRFEVVTHGATNPWGLDWNAEGEGFYTNCVIGHLFHLRHGARYQRMFGQDLNPYAYELMPWTSEHLHWTGDHWTQGRGGQRNDDLGGGHAHSGALFLLGDQWPAEMRGDLLMCNIHGNRINRDHIERTSAGFVGKYRPDLIKFNDPWFRGVAFAAAPDGGIYVADWCDVGECHDYKEVHRRSGRIYKFWHGAPRAWKPADLTALIDNPVAVDAGRDPWSARRVLQATYEKGDKTDARMVAAIAQRVIEKFETPAPLTVPQNLFELNFINAVGTEQVMKLLETEKLTGETYIDALAWVALMPPGELGIRDRPLAVRIQLLRLYAERLSKRFSPAKWNDEQLKWLENTPHDALIVELLGILQRLPHADRTKLLTHLWKHPTWKKPIPDRAADYGAWNAWQSMRLMAWYALEPVVGSQPDWAVTQLGECPDPMVRSLIVRRLTDEPDRAKLQAALQRIFAAQVLWNDPQRAAELLIALNAGLASFKDLPTVDTWPTLSAQLTTSPEFRLPALELGYRFGDPAVSPQLLALLDDVHASTNNRERALQLLARRKQTELLTRLPKLLDDQALRTTTIRAIGAVELTDGPRLLLTRYGQMTAEHKLAVVETLAGRKAWANELLTALADKRVPRADVPIYVARQIQLHKDDALNKQLETVWGVIRKKNPDVLERKRKLIAELTPKRLASADMQQGTAVFKANCAQCHSLFGNGGKVGPDLTGAQRGNLDYLLENILDPSGVVARDYRLAVLTLTDGRVLSGVVVADTAASLQLRTTSGDVWLDKSEIEERTQTDQSAMPEGLLDKLTPDEIRDLLGYLMRAKP